MHVLIIPGTYPGSYNLYRGVFFQSQVKALAETGELKVGVIAPDIRSGNELKHLKNIKTFGFEYNQNDLEGVPVYRKIGYNITPGTSLGVQKLFFQFTKRLFKIYVKNHGIPDILHAHISLHAGYAARKLSLEYKIPYLVTEHSSSVLKDELSKREKSIIKSVLSGACKSISVSTRLKDKIEQEFKVTSVVIPNLVKLPEKNRDKKTVRDDHLLLSVGTLIKPKGFEDLLKAFQICLQRKPKLKLKIVGDGRDATFFKKLAYQLGIAKSVEFTGAVAPEKIDEIMKSARIFISPSKFETFGVVLVEAAAAGTPLVSTRSGGPDDIVTPVNGVLCPVNNYEKLAAAILQVIKNRDKYDEQRIIDEAYKRFNKNRITKKIIKEYRGCLNY